MHGCYLPFVIVSFAVPQRYYHFEDKRQQEKGQTPVGEVILYPRHPPDAGQRHQDEQSSGDDRSDELEQIDHAGLLHVCRGSLSAGDCPPAGCTEKISNFIQLSP